MKENFQKALNFVLKWEGEYSNDPADPGGLTIYGISFKSYGMVVKRMNELYQQGKKEDAKKIAIEIYKKNYWEKLNCDNLPFPFDILTFDTGVNMGLMTAKEILNQAKDYKEFIILRIKKYNEIAQKNKNLQKFLSGWINRTIDLFIEVKKYGA